MLSQACTALIATFAVGLLSGSFVLRFVRNYVQPINPYVSEMHSGKKNTPTMGGLLIIIAILSVALCTPSVWHNSLLLLTLLCTSGFAVIGATDDILKIRENNHHGISGKAKLTMQSATAIIFLIFKQQFDQATYINLPWGGILELGFMYYPFTMAVIVGSSNAVNLTDGLDGLAAMPTVFVCLGLMTLGFLLPSNHFEVIWLSATLAGGTLAFLWFNAHPAEIFMGDVGSLMIGGLLGMIGVILHQELLFGIMSMLFVVETLSSIMQIASMKIRKKRIFLIAPIHHHFERKGHTETKIVLRMWIFSFIFVILGILLFACYTY